MNKSLMAVSCLLDLMSALRLLGKTKSEQAHQAIIDLGTHKGSNMTAHDIVGVSTGRGECGDA